MPVVGAGVGRGLAKFSRPGRSGSGHVEASKVAKTRDLVSIKHLSRASSTPDRRFEAGFGGRARRRSDGEGRGQRDGEGRGQRDGGGCDEVVVCMELGWPLPARPGNGRQHRAVRSLAAALSRFEAAELVVTGDLGVAPEVLAGLWPAVDRVTASSEEVERALRAAGAPAVRVVTPLGPREPAVPVASGRPVASGSPVGPGPPGAAQGPIGVVAVPVASHNDGLQGLGLDAAVGPLEPAERLLVARARRLLGRTARTLLGSRAPAVRAQVWRLGAALRPGALWARVRGKVADQA